MVKPINGNYWYKFCWQLNNITKYLIKTGSKMSYHNIKRQ